MRFNLKYKDYIIKEEENINIKLLDTFLNEYTIDTYCGDTFAGIDIKFLNNALSKRIEKESKLYNIYALIEIKSNFRNQGEIDILEFQDAFKLVINSVKRVEKIKIENMDFNLKNLITALNVAEKNLIRSKEELEKYRENEEAIKLNNRLRLINYNIKRDKENKKELNKPLQGIRVYSDLRFEGIDLEPYLFIYESIFSNLLRKEGIMLPGYSEIYLYIHRTLDEAKLNSSCADWSKSTYGEINVEKYLNSTEDEKCQMVCDSVCQGLRIISDFDHLDKDAIERVIRVVKKEGIKIELVYTKKENKNYMVKIIYTVPEVARAKALFKLKIKDKNTGKEGYVDIGYINLWYGPCINKIKITRKEIIIEGRKSLRAEISRSYDNLPDRHVFNIDEILKNADNSFV